MPTFIRVFGKGLLNVLSALIGAGGNKDQQARQAIQRVWQGVLYLAGIVGNYNQQEYASWAQLQAAIVDYTNGITSAFTDVFNQLKTFAFTLIPKAIYWAIHQASSWSQTQWTKDITKAVKTETDNRKTDVNNVRSATKNVNDYSVNVGKSLSGLWTRFLDAEKLVLALLKDAAKLADWLLSAMINAIIHFILDHGAPIAAWIVKTIFGNLPKYAHWFEDFLADII